jgi:TPR repeat protein
LEKIATSGRVCSVDHMVSIARKFGLVPDPSGASKASRWLENAAESAGQDSNDLYSIAAAYRDGVAGLPERRKAEEYFSQSLALGRKSAARDIADGHLKKLWASSDPLKAKNILLDLFRTGDVSAGNKLLSEYSRSEIPATTIDVKFVVDAMPGKIDAPAKYLFKLARLNEEGKLGLVDEKLAVQWLSLAASAGEPNAMFRLYNSYINAIGVERSPAKAVEWLQKSADAGNYRAAEGLAAAYETGFGLEKDAEKSAYWRDKAKSLKVQ